jgi:hypothetical protein
VARDFLGGVELGKLLELGGTEVVGPSGIAPLFCDRGRSTTGDSLRIDSACVSEIQVWESLCFRSHFDPHSNTW